MDKNRKPVPKSQFEISTKLHDAYVESQGNPNSAITPLPVFTNQTNPATSNTYRAQQKKAATTKDKQFTLGIEDHDEAIFYYFNNVIQPYVYQNTEKIAVPIIYGNPERWASVQKQGYYRDKNGKLMCPMIMVRRTSLEPNLSLASKVDANRPYGYATLSQGFSKSNTYSNFDVLNNRKPIKTVQAVVVPDYVTINYSCVVWTYFTEQMNKIVEAINYSSNAYWGDPNKFKFNAMISSFQNSETLTQGEERIIKTTFDIKLNGHLIPDTVLKSFTAEHQFSSKSTIKITGEFTTDGLGTTATSSLS